MPLGAVQDGGKGVRLVDSDALMGSFENVLGAAPCELNGYEIWEVLNSQEGIDAIPVEWLEDKELDYRTTGDKMFSDAFAVVIDEWQKGQEAQDG